MVTHLLLHGFAGTPASWAPLVPRLAGNVVAPALPGHNSAALASFDAHVEWLMAHAATLPRPLHLVGYSAGGRIVAGALARGVACDWASLVSTNLGLSDAERPERVRGDAAWSAMLRERGIDAFVEAWEAQPLFASQQGLTPAQRAWQRAERASLDPNALADAMDALSLGRMPDLRESMRALRLPWQLVVGALDAKFVDLARGAGAWKTATMAACGHNLPLEAPEGLSVLLNDFVSMAWPPPSH